MCTHTSLHRNLLGHRQQSHKFKTVMKGEDGSVPTISETYPKMSDPW